MKSLKKALRDSSPRSLKLSLNDTTAVAGNTHTLTQARCSDTGYDSQPQFQGAIDWLDISFRRVSGMTELYRIISELERLSSSEIDFSPTKPVFNGRMFDGSGFGTTGIRIWFTAGDPHDAFSPSPMQLKVALSGSVIAAIDQAELAQWLIGRMVKNELDCTRIDVCVDDRDRIVNLDDVLTASERDNFFNASYSGLQTGGKKGENKGRTIYFGSPSSSRRMRVYDKFIESGGKIYGVRWEVEFRKLLAREALYEWLEKSDEGEETVARWCKNIIVGCIDFRDCSGSDPNRNRCPRLEWFTRFIAKLQAIGIVIRTAVKTPTMQKSIDWVEKSVAPTMASLRAVLQADFPKYLEQLLESGTYRLSNLKRKIIAQSDKQKLCY